MIWANNILTPRPLARGPRVPQRLEVEAPRPPRVPPTAGPFAAFITNEKNVMILGISVIVFMFLLCCVLLICVAYRSKHPPRRRAHIENYTAPERFPRGPVRFRGIMQAMFPRAVVKQEDHALQEVVSEDPNPQNMESTGTVAETGEDVSAEVTPPQRVQAAMLINPTRALWKPEFATAVTTERLVTILRPNGGGLTRSAPMTTVCSTKPLPKANVSKRIHIFLSVVVLVVVS